jgi:imidazoleglycerol-phosphate dehydratase
MRNKFTYEFDGIEILKNLLAEKKGGVLISAHVGNFEIAEHFLGDIDVDFHHSVEDVGICLGDAFAEAIGDMRGITRYGSIILPMDETLILASVDVSGRAYLNYSLEIPTQKVGEFDTELTSEFFLAFTRRSNVTLHLKQLDGLNSHHIIEGTFKAFARALAAATKIDESKKDEIPSTKGVL